MNPDQKQSQPEFNEDRCAESLLRARARQQSMLAELAQRALVGTDLAILRDEAVSMVAQALELDYIHIFELLPDTDTLLLKTATGWPPELVDNFSLDIQADSDLNHTFQTKTPLMVTDFDTQLQFGPPALPGSRHVAGGLSVVIQGRRDKFGVLGGYTTSQRFFTEDDIHFLQAIANILGMAAERKQGEAQIVRRNLQLLTLQSAGMAITSNLELQYVLNTVTREMINLLDVEACTIYGWNEASNTISVLAGYYPEDWPTPRVLDDPLNLADYPLIKQALHKRSTLHRVTDQADLSPAELKQMEAAQINTLLILPMMFQERLVGLVAIMDRASRTFAEQETVLAQLLANQAAIAIENARLYTETRKILREQIALREVGTAISSTLDLDRVLSRIAKQMGHYVDVTSTHICIFDSENNVSEILARHIEPEACAAEQSLDLETITQLEHNFADAITFLQSNQPEVIQADDPNLTEAERSYLQQFQAKTLLTIPIQMGGQTIAYARLGESRQKRVFSFEEIAQCQGIAQQAAIAIENARLFEQTQAALQETETLYRVAHTLAQMDDEQEMFELVLTEFLRHLKLQQGGLLIIEHGQSILRAYMKDGQLVESGLNIPIADNPSLQRLLDTRQPLVIKDATHDPLQQPADELTVDLGVKSILLVPIIVQGEVIGILGGDAVETIHEFTEREISLASVMANQLSIAVENRRLQAETKRRALQLTVLHELDRAIASSLHLKDIYYAFAHHAMRLLPSDHMSITLVEDEELRINYVTDNNDEDDQVFKLGNTLPRQGSAVGWVITQGQPLLRHNIAADSRYAEDEALVESGIRSFMVIPLRVKGQVIGTWNIGRQQVGAFSPDEMEIAQSMADQLAITIENARLYDEVHQYLEELHTLNMISQTINSTLELQKILTIITEHTIRLVGVEATSVVLCDDTKGDLWFAATSGGGSDFLRDMRLAIGHGIVGWVVRYGEPALVPDVEQDPRFFSEIDHNSNFKTRSILCVPLQAKGQVIGAVEAINKEYGAFNQEDLRLLTSLVAPAATAIENARLFEQAQQEIAERQRAEAALEKERALLARRVAERTADLSAANAELARAARLKDEFLASMSHELRTPLTAILGLADVLKLEVYGPLTEKQVKSINSIEESGHHLLDLINDILDLSKIEAGKVELDITPVSIQTVCQASLQFIKQTSLKKQLKVFSKYDESVTTLLADERRLKQILVNLLNNSVKFTPEGGQVGLEVMGDSDRQMVDFIVWDTGIGIAPEDMSRLFQPFVQLDSRLARQFTGTGLGLALVRRMVEMHGGGISVESEVNQGTRFTISLPLHGIPRVEAPDETDAETSSLSSIRQVFILEDSPTTTSQLIFYFTRLGINAVAHPRGQDAIQHVLEVKPDVIILDILLPDSSGWDILAQLKAEPQTRDIPVLIISVVDEPSKGLALGATEYLVKPITQQQLQTSLSQIVQAMPKASFQNQPAQTAITASPLILLAEDQDTISEFLVDYLENQQQLRVIVARNGIEALEQARLHQPELILMDIQMPEMDGLEAIRRLRATPDLAQTPIIAVTALAMPGDRERCLEAGADAYLSKPIHLRELVELIQSYLASDQTSEPEN